MKKMPRSIAFLPALALAAFAQDVSWKELAPGDRIEVTLLNGATVSGTVRVPAGRTPPVDFSKESTLTLDLSLEYPGVAGTMTVAKRDLRTLRRLDPKLATDPPRDPEPAPRPAAKVEAPKAPEPKAEAPKQDPKAPEAPDKDAEELRKAQEFYAKFPAPDWGPERHTVIIQKQARGQVPTPTEREFESGYPALWEKGRAAAAKN
jgi:hypothetical protein